MECPVCHIPLLVVEKLEVELDCCVRCQGLWFDEDELEILLATAGMRGSEELVRSLLGGGAAGAAEKSRRCPRCRRPMRKVFLDEPAARAVLDLCPRGDGFWLDHGELDEVVAALEGDDRARDRLSGYLGMLEGAGRERPRS